MGKNLILVAAIGALAFAFGCSSGSSGGTTAYSVDDFNYPLTSTDVAGGSEVYAEFCEGCHTDNQQGSTSTTEGGWLTTADPRYYDVQ